MSPEYRRGYDAGLLAAETVIRERAAQMDWPSFGLVAALESLANRVALLAPCGRSGRQADETRSRSAEGEHAVPPKVAGAEGRHHG